MDLKNGFVNTVLIILIVTLIGTGYFVVTKNRLTATEKLKTEPPKEISKQAPQPKPGITLLQPIPTAEIVNWKLYRNKEYGFEFSYPEDMRLDVEREPKLVILQSRDSRKHRIIDIAESVGLYKTGPNALFRVRVVGANKSIILEDGITWMTRFDCGTYSSGLSEVGITTFMGYQAVKVTSLREVFGGGGPYIAGEFFQYCVDYPLSPIIIDFDGGRSEEPVVGELIFSTFKFVP